MMELYPWRYQCSKCDELLHPDDVSEHVQAHRREPSWDGHMSLTRVDLEEEEHEHN